MSDIVHTDLLIGGPADGRRMKVPHCRSLYVLYGDEEVIYLPQTFRGQTKTFVVWVHQDLPIDRAIEMLFDLYPPERRK